MRRHVEGVPEIYRPGAFWSDLLESNLAMLRDEGIRNLKRSVSNTYFNWLVLSALDPMFQHAVRHWLRHPSLGALRTRMESGRGLHGIAWDRQATGGDRVAHVELSGRAAAFYRFYVSALWERAERDDPLGLTARLEEPEVGNPLRIWRDTRLISQDLANSILECNYAARSGHVRDGARIAELGGGYGRSAHVFQEAARVVYCIFDIPPALAVSQWYLGEVLGRDRIVPFHPDRGPDDLSALAPGSVAFFTPDQLELVPDGWFDLTQTISTLPEMPRRQADHYVSQLTAKCSGEFVLKQWRSWENEADGTHWSEETCVPPAGWRMVARRIDPAQPAFYDQRWRRERPPA